MKIILFLSIFLSILYAQDTIEELETMKLYNMSEEKILHQIESQNMKEPLTPELYKKLKKLNFSSDFIKKYAEIVKKNQNKPDENIQQYNIPKDKTIAPKNTQQPNQFPNKPTHAPNKEKQNSNPPNMVVKKCSLNVFVSPKGAGKIEITPKPDEYNQLPIDTIVRIIPISQEPYLFDSWSQDAVGTQPLEFKLDKNYNITANFKIPHNKNLEPPKPLNNPKEFKETRKQGYRYNGSSFAIIQGKGSNKKWGFKGEVNYNYTYNMSYTSKIQSNNGYRIIEYRTFNQVRQNLFVSPIRFSLGIEHLSKITQIITLGFEFITLFHPFHPAISFGVRKITKTPDLLSKYFEFSEEQVNSCIENLQKYIITRGFGNAIQRQLQNMKNTFLKAGKVFGYPANMNLLEGKTFKLIYEDGIGLVKIDVVNPNQIVSLAEKELIERAFYMADYYIFKDKDKPLKKIDVGTSWKVEARNFASILDPRMSHTSSGSISLSRQQDVQMNNKNYATFSISPSTISMMDTERTHKMIGEVTLTGGEIHYDLDLKYVFDTKLQGTLNYKQISKDHLLFETTVTTKPTFQIYYTCDVVPDASIYE